MTFFIGMAIGAGLVLVFMNFCFMLDNGPDEYDALREENRWLHDQLDAALMENARLREVDADE